jgi:hypothetical protein
MPPVDDATASRRGKGRLIAVVTASCLLVVALIVVGYVHALRSLDNGIGQAFSGLGQDGAAKASLADSIAKANHIPDGALTPALLSAQQSDAIWLSSGDSAPPISGGHTSVSIRAQGDHVVTAVNFGSCQYGLTVAARNDPIIGQYDLPGLGTYWAFSDTPGPTQTCSADSAPTSGWSRANSSVLKAFNAPPVGLNGQKPGYP